MPALTKDQIRHEVINLRRTLRLLERSFKEEDWTRCTSKDRDNKWLKSQSILSGISHCRGVLQNVSPSDYDYGLGDRRSTSGKQFHEDAKALLDRLEHEMIEIDQDLRPRARRPNPILPTLPRPSPSINKAHPTNNDESHLTTEETRIPVHEAGMKGQTPVASSELLLESELYNDDDIDPLSTLSNRLPNPAATLLPPSLPSSTALFGESPRASSSVPGSLQTSTALHEDLSVQLAQMARQLRRNAEQFNEALADDEGIVKAMQEKLEGNYDEVTKERVRLRDHSAKSWGTTWFIFISMLVVMIAFFLTFLVIRIT